MMPGATPGGDPNDWYVVAEKILLPLFTAALGGGFAYLSQRKRATAEADAIDGDLFSRQVKMLAELWEKQNGDLKDELGRERERNDRMEEEIKALRKALDQRTAELRGDPYRGVSNGSC